MSEAPVTRREPPPELSPRRAAAAWRSHHLHGFCSSLLEPANRVAFRADEPGYLQRWPMTEAQRAAVLARDWDRLTALGGRPYFLAQLAAADSLWA